MRSTSLVVFARLIGAFGTGTYLGAALAGVVAVATGQAFDPGSPWLTGMPVLAILGAIITPGVAWLTRHWLAPRLPHRFGWSTLAGLIILPLAVAAGQLHEHLGRTVEMPLMFGCGIATGVLWSRWFRRPTPRPTARATRARTAAG